MVNKKILITSALPYVNNVPHLGNIIGCVLSADVFARYARNRYGKENVLYVCGSDEHGTATETKAKEEGLSPQALCDKYYAIHKKIYEYFNISFDIFGRTSSPEHKDMTTDIFNKVNDAGYVEEKEVTQPYCETCKTFLSDRYVEGTCPYCGYEDARGDQCDKCGKLLNAEDLINPRCKTDGSKPVLKKSKHLFLSLNTLQPLLEQWTAKQSNEGQWTANSIRTTNAWFKEGLKARAITRDLKWGIPIPETAYGGQYSGKVFYVWFDAPIGYMSITKQLLGERWKNWWMKPEEVKLYQFMGKDNIPFHSIIFPGSLLAASGIQNVAELQNCDYTLVHHLSVTEYLQYEGGKFSKSRNIGVFGDDAQQTGLPVDIFRYVLLSNRPETSDTNFTWDELGEKLNNELVATLGNLINRTLMFINNYCDGEITGEPQLSDVEEEFISIIEERTAHIIERYERVQLRDSIKGIMEIARLGNGYFQNSEPWKQIKENPVYAKTSLYVLAHLCRDLALLLEPFMPATAQSILDQMNLSKATWEDLGKLNLEGHTIGETKHLFSKIEQETITDLKKKFAGEKTENSEQKTGNRKKEEKSAKKTETASPEEIFAGFDLRVAEITNVTQHPNADKLFIEELDLGSMGKRQIVSGLAGHYTPEELLGKKIIVVANLKPAKLRGEMSQGMLLAAENTTDEVGIVLADAIAVNGEQVSVDGITQKPKEQITIEEFFSIQMESTKEAVLIQGKQLLVKGKAIMPDKSVVGKVC